MVGDIKDASTLGVGKGEKSALKMGWFAMSLDGGPQLTEELICAGAQCIVHALDYVHGMGLVHMDIKPGNFLLKYNGNWLLSGEVMSMSGGLHLFDKAVFMSTWHFVSAKLRSPSTPNPQP